MFKFFVWIFLSISLFADVSIDLKERMIVENTPVFRILISGWKPNGLLAIYGVGPGGEQIPVIKPEDNVRADSKGVATFDIPYELKGFYPGKWAMIIGGDSGNHGIRMYIPNIQAR